MYPLSALSVGMIMMAGQIYAAPIRGLPAGRGTFPKRSTTTSLDTSDPISNVDFYFPFKELQIQIQSANIVCPAPGGPYDQALSLVTTNCPSSGSDDVPINPCCTQNMLLNLAGAVACVQHSDTSLALSMQSATKGFIRECQQAGIQGLLDPFSASSSAVSLTRPTTSSLSTSAGKSLTSTVSFSSSPSSLGSSSTSFATSSSSTSSSASSAATSTSNTSQSSSASENILYGPSGGIFGAIGAVLVTILVLILS